MKQYNVAIVGATGAVGEQMRLILESRGFPVGALRLLASPKSEGKRLTWRRTGVSVTALAEDSFADVDIALFSAGSAISRRYAPIARDAGAVVIDNSSAWRMEEGVPLVVPEVNRQALAGHSGIIANPNCSTIQMVVVLKPLHDRWGLKRVIVSTYQAVSGTGRLAVEELLAQARAYLAGEPINAEIYPHQIAFNLLPHIDVFGADGYSNEERKMVNETRKIMDLPDLAMTATTVRVPIVVSHSESVNAEFVGSPDIDAARKILAAAPGVEVVDDPENAIYPMPITAAGKDSCYVGRLRLDGSAVNGLNLWVVADNLRKGAALNAVQIAECLISDGYLK
ncbi:MAG: aspartate-semialdehyde dehydrogenase [Actinomycetota bacterium]|nr:aspartate-semialdehyde dehydrogenase [Actinomycetota bacterium]